MYLVCYKKSFIYEICKFNSDYSNKIIMTNRRTHYSFINETFFFFLLKNKEYFLLYVHFCATWPPNLNSELGAPVAMCAALIVQLAWPLITPTHIM